MNTRPLRELAVTELGLGGSSVGNLFHAITDDDAHSTIDAAWAGGVRCFDTAPHYGLGLSELRLGRALKDRHRDDYVISTKVGRLLEPNPAPTGSDITAGGFDVPDTYRRRFDFSRDGICRSLDASLTRLGLDRVDIVYLHDPDDHLDEAISEGLPALTELGDQGVIRAMGVGMNDWAAPLRILRESDLDVVMLAGRWTLLDRSGAPLIAECERRGIPIVAAAPFNSGLLARDRRDDDATYDYAPAPPDIRTRVQELADLCHRFDIPLPAAALQYPLRSAAVTSVVCGFRTATEVDSALDNLARTIPPAAWTRLAA